MRMPSIAKTPVMQPEHSAVDRGSADTTYGAPDKRIALRVRPRRSFVPEAGRNGGARHYLHERRRASPISAFRVEEWEEPVAGLMRSVGIFRRRSALQSLLMP